MSVFKDKTLLITGGTGSFGNAVLNRFLRTDIGEIRIFSRDEKKQDDMRHDFQARMPEVANKIKDAAGSLPPAETGRSHPPAPHRRETGRRHRPRSLYAFRQGKVFAGELARIQRAPEGF